MEPRPRPALSNPLAGVQALLLPRLLWAACHDRNEPAIAAGRLQLVAAVAHGALAYDPRAHALRPLCGLDLRIARVPEEPQRGFELVYVATMTRGDAGMRRTLASLDAASVAARVERLCVADGLWLLARGPREARALGVGLGVESPRFVSFVQSIGWSDERQFTFTR